jgi:hypothetical protein
MGLCLGMVEYLVDGHRSRIDGPTIVFADGSEWWYYNNRLHREDGPAIVSSSGYVAYYRHGVYHREDGPAVTMVDGTKKWYFNGVLHRYGVEGNMKNHIDSPTIERVSGKHSYYVRGFWVCDGDQL